MRRGRGRWQPRNWAGMRKAVGRLTDQPRSEGGSVWRNDPPGPVLGCRTDFETSLLGGASELHRRRVILAEN